MLKNIPTLFFAILYLTACQSPEKPVILPTTGAFMNMTPSDTPRLLAPALLASPLTEYNGTFSSEGKEFFYTSEGIGKSCVTRTKLQSDDIWSEPKIADFSGEYSDYDPLFSPDGKRLYFSSERPIPGAEKSSGTNIWFVEKTGTDWSNPTYVPLTGQGDYFSSITDSGAIYFNVWNTGKILKATPSDTGFVTQNLPPVVNWDTDAGDPFISPKEDYLIFRSYKNSLGNGDLYISFKIDETWTTPQNLGKPINSSAHEMCPYVTTDGKFFIFASAKLQSNFSAKAGESLKEWQQKIQSADNGSLNIYYQSADFIEVMRKQYTER